MGLDYIDGHDLVRMLKSGCAVLESNKARVDALNVFPVPDGDTGTNMYLTLLSAVKECEKKEEDNIGAVGKAVSMGSLMGARGNSGVILSQVFRGISRELDAKDKVDATLLAAALQAGSDTAYKAVMKPVEGTILTVVREVARAAQESARKTGEIPSILTDSLEAGRKMLERTPSMLPILREAGVIDAGGQGFLFILEGMLGAVKGETAMRTSSAEVFSAGQETDKISLEYGYCTEVLIKGAALSISGIQQALAPLGDSLLVVGEDDLVKIHIHSNHPGRVLENCIKWGTLHDIKINNMEEEAQAKLELEKERPAPSRKIGLVAVGQGEGWNQILSSMGVDRVVIGGQTMNPSTEDLVNAALEVNADNVIILPNNKNIVMAAEQAVDLIDKPVRVIPTTSVMQAVAGLVVYDGEGELDEVAGNMEEEAGKVRTGEVTNAVRDSRVNGLEIQEGDYLGIIDDVVKLRGDSAQEVALKLLEAIAGDGSLISLYYGADVTEEEAEELRETVENEYSLFDVELHYGGQAYYQYLISVE